MLSTAFRKWLLCMVVAVAAMIFVLYRLEIIG
jgi:hypothetical protein